MHSLLLPFSRNPRSKDPITQVKVETQPRTRTISPDIPEEENNIVIKKTNSPAPSGGIGRLFGWS